MLHVDLKHIHPWLGRPREHMNMWFDVGTKVGSLFHVVQMNTGC